MLNFDEHGEEVDYDDEFGPSEGEVWGDPVAESSKPDSVSTGNTTKTDHRIQAHEDLTGGFTPSDKSSVAVPLGSQAAATCDERKITPLTALDIQYHKMQLEEISDAVLQLCANLYFRQSLIKDFLTCPMMMFYKWILGFEEEDTFFAALLGTAGHSVIEMMHQERNVKHFEYTSIDLATLFVQFGDKALKSSSVPPRVSAKYPTVSAQMNAAAPEYIQMLQGYGHDRRNQDFHATVNEQMFALCIEIDTSDITRSGPGKTFIFTGTIDQAGFYGDGSFAVRDIKFRMPNFKPGPTQLQLDLQLSLYAYAIRHGYPACHECKPRYSVEGQLMYSGPCETCSAKIGTNQWPRLLAERTELIWMRDYLKRSKNQYAKYVTSTTETEINPKTGRKRKKQVLNENYVHGYKVGDPCGPAILRSERSTNFLSVHMTDILRVAGMIQAGQFFRKAGEHCNFWCKFRKPCVDMLETQVQEIDYSTMNDRIATLDPFGDT